MRKKRRRGPFADVDLELLHDSQGLLDWIPRAARQRGSKISTSERTRFNVLCAAEHALRVGRNPVRLFVWLVKGARWQYITDADDDRGRERLNVLQRVRLQQPGPERGPPQRIAEVLAELMPLRGCQSA